METMVATALIITVFMISSMILNNLFVSMTSSNTRSIDAHLNKLEYLYHNKQLDIPYDEEFEKWRVTVEHIRNSIPAKTEFIAVQIETKKTIEREGYASY